MARNNSISEIDDFYDLIDDQLKTASALCDAAAILAALERSPSHHDTHPGHNIMTGGGYAHGLKIRNDTLPLMLTHATYLMSESLNYAGLMREGAIASIKDLSIKIAS